MEAGMGMEWNDGVVVVAGHDATTAYAIYKHTSKKRSIVTWKCEGYNALYTVYKIKWSR